MGRWGTVACVWDGPQVDFYRRSGGALSADQGLAPSDEHHEMRRRRPVWLVLAFYALMVALVVWLLATDSGDTNGSGGVNGEGSEVVVMIDGRG